MKCPLCDVEGRAAPTCWGCGYDFERRDARVAIRRIKREAARANVMWLGGLVMLFLAPVLWFAGVLVGMLGGALLASGGVMLVTFGIINGDRAAKQLVKAVERTQLPAARIVE